jgi:hypothetical protein
MTASLMRATTGMRYMNRVTLHVSGCDPFFTLSGIAGCIDHARCPLPDPSRVTLIQNTCVNTILIDQFCFDFSAFLFFRDVPWEVVPFPARLWLRDSSRFTFPCNSGCLLMKNRIILFRIGECSNGSHRSSIFHSDISERGSRVSGTLQASERDLLPLKFTRRTGLVIYFFDGRSSKKECTE